MKCVAIVMALTCIHNFSIFDKWVTWVNPITSCELVGLSTFLLPSHTWLFRRVWISWCMGFNTCHTCAIYTEPCLKIEDQLPYIATAKCSFFLFSYSTFSVPKLRDMLGSSIVSILRPTPIDKRKFTVKPWKHKDYIGHYV